MAISPDKIQSVKQRFSIIGNSTQLIEAIERALQVAPIDLSVLIIGESGSGKEFFPQVIHHNSARKHSKYIAVNCGAIPEGTIDSELFGHEKGAFTGAISSRKGYFEEANGGTIFLDEVAELPLTTQARLLRVLESGEYLRVGSSEVQKTNIRVVAATNKDMAKAVADGKFREDLYYRLSTVQINVPPLRERGNDILLLTRKFASDFASQNRTPLISFNDDAKQALLSYGWPGNVRQLKNVVEQMALFEAGKNVDSATVRKYLPAPAVSMAPVPLANTQFDYNRERELLFKMIMQLQQEIESVKMMVQGGKTEKTSTALITQDLNDVKRDSKQLTSFTPDDNPLIHNRGWKHDLDDHKIVHDFDEADFAEVTHEAQPAARTLEDTERETIIETLKKNGGKRNLTAQELGISERTLYRKIKEYGLDNKNHFKI